MATQDLRGLSTEDLRDIVYALHSVTNDQEWPPRFHQLRSFCELQWTQMLREDRDAVHPVPVDAPLVDAFIGREAS